MSAIFDCRHFIRTVVASGGASMIRVTSWSAEATPKKGKVVVIGGGFGGGTAAKYLKVMDPGIDVTLIERNKQYVCCPLSNEVISGERDIASLTRDFDRIAKRGVNVVHDEVTAVDTEKKTVTTKGGKTFGYEALVMSPGVDFKWGSIQGYTRDAAVIMPHAWKAGEQTLLLKKQVESVPDGGKVIIAVPPAPFTCPGAPYERAAQIAHYFKHHGRIRSKVVILDANDSFIQKPLFEQGWKQYYEGIIEWVPGANGGKVVKVDPKVMTALTDFDAHKADAINIIPPHIAGKIAITAGLTNEKGWCEIDPMTMESQKQRDDYLGFIRRKRALT